MSDVVSHLVVGSGISSLGVCWSLIRAGHRPTVVDIGLNTSLTYDSTSEKLLVGERADDLKPLSLQHPSISPILNLPAFQFSAESVTTAKVDGSAVVSSQAFGGLGNAWGAGTFRFSEEDLVGFPFSKKEIDPIYDQIGELMNVLWEDDELTAEFGKEQTRPRQARFSAFSTQVLEKFSQLPADQRADVRLGRPRLAMHERWPDDEKLRNLHPLQRAFFNPQHIFKKWIQERKIDYRSGVTVISFEDTSDGVTVNCSSGPITAKKVYLGAGAVNTARIVFQSSKLPELTRPFFDNPGFIVPFFFWKSLEQDNTSASQRIPTFQLTATFAAKKFSGRAITNFLDLKQLSLTELIRYLPLPIPVLVHWQRLLTDRILIGYNFFSCEAENAGQIRLSDKKCQVIPSAHGKPGYADCKPLVHVAKKLGLFPLRAGAKQMPFGSSIHYGGSFPFSNQRGEWSTDSLGRLPQSKNVFLIDGSTFPRLPAKNFSMTLAANAYRIGQRSLEEK